MSSLLFGEDISEYAEPGKVSMASAGFGERIAGRRYKMPLLPGEAGPKSGGDWVPRGVRSATNLAGAISDTRALGNWERERSQIGLGLRADLAERLAFLVRKARAQGIDFAELGQDEAHKAVRAELELIHAEAKAAAGGNERTVQGTNRHDAWEERGKSSLLFGSQQVNEEIERLEELLERNHLVRVPGLQERTVRNVALEGAGRFDDVLMSTRTGLFYMADLKTGRKPFWSMLELGIQLTVYATAEFMLPEPEFREMSSDTMPRNYYVPGPKHHVSQQWGIVMRMPSDGGAPELKRVNLVQGLSDARTALAVCNARSRGQSKAAKDEAVWIEGEL